jgi:hypothetical protein
MALAPVVFHDTMVKAELPIQELTGHYRWCTSSPELSVTFPYVQDIAIVSKRHRPGGRFLLGQVANVRTAL